MSWHWHNFSCPWHGISHCLHLLTGCHGVLSGPWEHCKFKRQKQPPFLPTPITRDAPAVAARQLPLPLALKASQPCPVLAEGLVCRGPARGLQQGTQGGPAPRLG